MGLEQEKCIACRGDAPKITYDEAAELQLTISKWTIIEKADILQLERTFKFKNFADAISFAQAVGKTSEDEGHHPRLIVEWGQVNVEWWTHKIHGLHRNDFIMAAKTDEIHHRINIS